MALSDVSVWRAGSVSQFSNVLQFLVHQKICYKACICADTAALNVQLIRKGGPDHLSEVPSIGESGGIGGYRLIGGGVG